MPAEWSNEERRREAIIARFTAWLDGVLEDESPPEGIDAELIALVEEKPLEELPEACSEQELWASLTTLAQEVKLQGRAFQGLTDTVAPLQASMEDIARRENEDDLGPLRQALAAIETSRSDLERRARADAEAAVWREIIDLFLDLRGRLLRGNAGLETAAGRLRTSRRRTLQWLPSARHAMAEAAESVEAIREGNSLLLERLDDALAKVGVEEIPAEGRPFDANTMKAVDVESRDDVPAGTVSAVHRAGYAWHGETYQIAEVTVTRPAAKGESNT